MPSPDILRANGHAVEGDSSKGVLQQSDGTDVCNSAKFGMKSICKVNRLTFKRNVHPEQRKQVLTEVPCPYLSPHPHWQTDGDKQWRIESPIQGSGLPTSPLAQGGPNVQDDGPHTAEMEMWHEEAQRRAPKSRTDPIVASAVVVDRMMASGEKRTIRGRQFKKKKKTLSAKRTDRKGERE